MPSFTPTAARQLLDQLPGPVGPGLTSAELARVEQTFGFAFNPDHRTLLGAGLPQGKRWPDWRHGDVDDLREWIDEPIEGVIVDIAENGFWWSAWGKRPQSTDDAVEEARLRLTAVPPLVPVYGHRYCPALPEAGLPVFSVVQADVIVYGVDMADYLCEEFGLSSERAQAEPKRVPFWTDLNAA